MSTATGAAATAGTHTILRHRRLGRQLHHHRRQRHSLVSKARLTVTADDKSKLYGDPVPTLTFQITGFVYGETATVVSGLPSLDTTATTNSPVGIYPITVGLGTLSAANYDFPDLINGTLSVVTPVTVGVNSSASISTYGDSLVFHASVAPVGSGGSTPTGTIEFLVDGVDLGSAVTLVSGTASSISSTKIPAVRTPSLRSTQATQVMPPTQGRLPRLSTRRISMSLADDKFRLAGQPNPVLTVSYSGFVNGDGPASLASPAAVATSATASSPAGTYPINVSGATSPNYAITFRDGTLTVTSPSPPPLVTIMSVRTVMNKKHLATQILVTFSGPVNATEAQSLDTPPGHSR